MTNATSTSEGHTDLILYPNAQLQGLHLQWVSSSAINLCYRAGHHACPFPRAFPGKWHCEAPDMVGECHLCHIAAAWAPRAACPDAVASPSFLFSHLVFRKAWEKRETGGPLLWNSCWVSPSSPYNQSPEPIIFHKAIFWPPESYSPQRTWLKEDQWHVNRQFQSVFKSVAKWHLPG